MTDSPSQLSSTSLLEVVVIGLSDHLVVKAWSARAKDPLDEWAVVSGNLHRQVVEMLRLIRGGACERITIEGTEQTVVVTAVQDDLVAVLTFRAQVPLGLVQAQARQWAKWLKRNLRTGRTPASADTVRRLVAEIGQRAPQPEAVLAHLANTAGVSTADLQEPERLSDEQLEAVLSAIPGRAGP
ncbi:MAG TPA: hypothetical protein RMG48_21135 [Myxococcales bacterium LLY-WYZ-16_1]|nr:hypothetical protein [Myxococcales bacterium LLY-WYZ-16_1]